MITQGWTSTDRNPNGTADGWQSPDGKWQISVNLNAPKNEGVQSRGPMFRILDKKPTRGFDLTNPAVNPWDTSQRGPVKG